MINMDIVKQNFTDELRELYKNKKYMEDQCVCYAKDGDDFNYRIYKDKSIRYSSRIRAVLKVAERFGIEHEELINNLNQVV